MSAPAATHGLPEVPLFIGGEPVVTGNWLDVMDPAAPARAVGRVALADAALSKRAVDVAHAASNGWGATAPERRVEILLAALAGLEAERAENAELLVQENGKIRGEAMADVSVFSNRFRLAAELVGQLSERRRLPRVQGAAEPPRGAPPFRSEVMHLPLGVVSIVVPFNWPLAILSASLPYALV